LSLHLSRPHLPSTLLFPYTTLFRSRGRLRMITVRSSTYTPFLSATARRFWVGDLRRSIAPAPPGPTAILSMYVSGALSRLPFSADRKSTRLNSSHQIISYAVFFL